MYATAGAATATANDDDTGLIDKEPANCVCAPVPQQAEFGDGVMSLDESRILLVTHYRLNSRCQIRLGDTADCR
jgi:hypothetical protein